MSVPVPEGFDPKAIVAVFAMAFFTLMVITWMLSRMAKRRRENG